MSFMDFPRAFTSSRSTWYWSKKRSSRGIRMAAESPERVQEAWKPLPVLPTPKGCAVLVTNEAGYLLREEVSAPAPDPNGGALGEDFRPEWPDD